MRWILAWHLIFMVSWFAGLFYLPRLFVYHIESEDLVSLDRFKIMEKRLFYFIMTPAGILTTIFGLWLLFLNLDFYKNEFWMILKLILVLILWLYHISCGIFVSYFKYNKKPFNALFFRFFNEIPSLLLIGIIILAIVRPTF